MRSAGKGIGGMLWKLDFSDRWVVAGVLFALPFDDLLKDARTLPTLFAADLAATIFDLLLSLTCSFVMGVCSEWVSSPVRRGSTYDQSHLLRLTATNTLATGGWLPHHFASCMFALLFTLQMLRCRLMLSCSLPEKVRQAIGRSDAPVPPPPTRRNAAGGSFQCLAFHLGAPYDTLRFKANSAIEAA